VNLWRHAADAGYEQRQAHTEEDKDNRQAKDHVEPTAGLSEAEADKRLFVRLPPRVRKEIADEIESGATPRPSFFLLVGLSAVIAAYGLIQNSPAVIIGAMLVAPLMTPIFAIALGAVGGDRKLLTLGLRSEAIGAGLAIGVAFVCGAFGPNITDLSRLTEIAARINPSLMDLAIAIAAGAAGAYAMTREDVSAALPGVAIAVALLPPLAVVGLELAARQYVLAGRAFALFAANFVAINLFASVVFALSGFTPRRHLREAGRVARRFGVSAFAFLVMVGILTYFLAGINRTQRLTGLVEETLKDQVRGVKGARLEPIDPKTDIAVKSGVLEVNAVVLTPKAFDGAKVADAQNVLASKAGRAVSLTIRSIVAVDANSKGFIEEPTQEPQPGPTQQPKPLPLSECRGVVKDILAEQLSRLSDPQARLIGDPVVRPLDYAARILSVEAKYSSSKSFTVQQRYEISNMMSAATRWEIELSLERTGQQPAPPAGTAPSGKPGAGGGVEQPPSIKTGPSGGSG
jgi:uncharacterized hydrophobic protein (TIGR00271 family)